LTKQTTAFTGFQGADMTSKMEVISG